MRGAPPSRMQALSSIECEPRTRRRAIGTKCSWNECPLSTRGGCHGTHRNDKNPQGKPADFGDDDIKDVHPSNAYGEGENLRPVNYDTAPVLYEVTDVVFAKVEHLSGGAVFHLERRSALNEKATRMSCAGGLD